MLFNPLDLEVLSMGILKKLLYSEMEDDWEKHNVQLRKGKSLSRIRQNFYDKNRDYWC